MIYIISIIEIALFIVLPLIIYCQRSYSTQKQIILNIILLYLIWFFSYACMHELSHMFGSWIMGTKISNYQLIPPFWKGDFRTAFVNSLFEKVNQAIVSLIMPYIRDIIFLIIGFWVFKRKRISNHFLIGLFLILLILSPLYDIINNYSGFVFISSGDFKELSKEVGVIYANLIGLLFVSIAIFMTFRIFIITRNRHFY